MMNHQQSERAERQSEKKEVSEEIAEEKVTGCKNPTGDASGQPEEAHACGNQFCAVSQSVNNGDHCSFTSFCCSAGVRSDVLMLWLSFSARMYAAIAQRL